MMQNRKNKKKEEDFDQDDYPRVCKKLVENKKYKPLLEWKCNAPIIFYHVK